MLYQSKPQRVEAIQWTGDNWTDITNAIPHRTRMAQHGDDPATDTHLELLAGVDGFQGWVPVPVGHWLVHPPGDLNDVWPVENDYFQKKYEEVPFIG
jgi:hypothetical protein